MKKKIWTSRKKKDNHTNDFFLNFFVSFQQKLKEEREAKRSQLDERHEFIMDGVASSLNLEKADVEDAVLEGDTVSLNILCVICSYCQIYVLVPSQPAALFLWWCPSPDLL